MYPGVTPFNIGRLTVREYNKYLDQAFNMRGFHLGDKFKLLTYWEEQEKIKKEIQ